MIDMIMQGCRILHEIEILITYNKKLSSQFDENNLESFCRVISRKIYSTIILFNDLIENFSYDPGYFRVITKWYTTWILSAAQDLFRYLHIWLSDHVKLWLLAPYWSWKWLRDLGWKKPLLLMPSLTMCVPCCHLLEYFQHAEDRVNW